MKIAAALAALAACVSVGCATRPAPETQQAQVVRTRAPLNYEQAITNFYDLTIAGPQKGRELQFGQPEPGNCSMASRNTSGHLGWVVPVQYKTKAADSRVTITTQFFWFSEETIKGVTRRIELCP
jgi:hypothetical protein